MKKEIPSSKKEIPSSSMPERRAACATCRRGAEPLRPRAFGGKGAEGMKKEIPSSKLREDSPL